MMPKKCSQIFSLIFLCASLVASPSASSLEFKYLENLGNFISFSLTGDDDHYHSFNVPLSWFVNYQGRPANYCSFAEIYKDDVSKYLRLVTDVGIFAVYYTSRYGITYINIPEGCGTNK